MPAYKGPGPPSPTWDGLSVLVSNVANKAKASDLLVEMSKGGCAARSARRLQPNGAKYQASWLVRLADPKSAVKSLIAHRRVFGQKVGVSGVDPAACELVPEPSSDEEEEEEKGEGEGEGEGCPAPEAADWRPAVRAMVCECFEYWLGPDNLSKDAFLRRHVRSRADRFVPVRVFREFSRMKMLTQDLGEIAEAIRASPSLEVAGEGEDLLVRGRQDHSVRPEESPELVARQCAALARLQGGDAAGAVRELRLEYYLRHAGPAAAGPR